jgi:hypothetical protein
MTPPLMSVTPVVSRRGELEVARTGLDETVERP